MNWYVSAKVWSVRARVCVCDREDTGVVSKL